MSTICKRRRTMRIYITIVVILLFFALSCVYIMPMEQKQKSGLSSSELQQITHKTDNTTRVDYVDNNGEITVAVDYGYATRVIISEGKSNTEIYYDDYGELTSTNNGYYGIKKEYDNKGYNYRSTYLGKNEEIIMNLAGYAIEEKKYNEDGRVICIKYYDCNYEPVLTAYYGYGVIYEYDEKGNICKITYIDNYMHPMITNLGYASVSRTFYTANENNSGKIQSEYYFDENDKPICLSLGQYGEKREYDEEKNAVIITYTDYQGRPIMTKKGYTTIIRTFYSDNSIATERYFDNEMRPVSLLEGQYGIKIENGQMMYLNKNGNKMINVKNLLNNNSWLVIAFAASIVCFSIMIKRDGNKILMILYILIIVYFTLMYRYKGNTNINLELLWSYKKFFIDGKVRSDLLKNIWLFIPFGSILFRLYAKKRILFLIFLLSGLIEYIQYLSGIGLCEFDDVISNGLGGFIGYETSKAIIEMKDIRIRRNCIV